LKIRFRRILKHLVLSLLALAVVLAIVATWLIRRAWPKTEGKIVVPGLSAPVSGRPFHRKVKSGGGQ
jgi:hypothetical protein